MAIDIHEDFPGSLMRREQQSELPFRHDLESRAFGSVAFRFSNNIPNLQGWKDVLGDPRVASWPESEAAVTRAYEERSRAEATQAYLRSDFGG